MKTVTLKIDDGINDRFHWLLDHFSPSEIRILEQSEYINDNDYLNSVGGMVQSIKKARSEPTDKGVKLDSLDW